MLPALSSHSAARSPFHFAILFGSTISKFGLKVSKSKNSSATFSPFPTILICPDWMPSEIVTRRSTIAFRGIPGQGERGVRAGSLLTRRIGQRRVLKNQHVGLSGVADVPMDDDVLAVGFRAVKLHPQKIE